MNKSRSGKDLRILVEECKKFVNYMEEISTQADELIENIKKCTNNIDEISSVYVKCEKVDGSKYAPEFHDVKDRVLARLSDIVNQEMQSVSETLEGLRIISNQVRSMNIDIEKLAPHIRWDTKNSIFLAPVGSIMQWIQHCSMFIQCLCLNVDEAIINFKIKSNNHFSFIQSKKNPFVGLMNHANVHLFKVLQEEMKDDDNDYGDLIIINNVEKVT